MKYLLLSALTLALTACHPTPACTVQSTKGSALGYMLTRSSACQETDLTRYRWLRKDGSYGTPGENGLAIRGGEYTVEGGNGAHVEYALNGGRWQRIEASPR